MDNKTCLNLNPQIFKRSSQGWIVTLGSFVDVWSDIVINNRTVGHLTSMTTIYRWGYSIFQLGIGFGWPLLYGLPEPVLRCDSTNFNELVNQYGLDGGVKPLFDAGFPTAEVRYCVCVKHLLHRPVPPNYCLVDNKCSLSSLEVLPKKENC